MSKQFKKKKHYDCGTDEESQQSNRKKKEQMNILELKFTTSEL